MLQMTARDKTPEEEWSEVEISNLPKKFKITIVKMIKELGRRTDAQSEKLEVFNKELENMKTCGLFLTHRIW